ncbi:MAG: hypothetical protein M3380_21105 [Chloroflexota bacterium]|nr:hypothetical protein [Chloroflexota bacterium]
MSDRSRSGNADEQAYTPDELAAGEAEARMPTDALGGRVGGEGAGVTGLGATTESQTGGALTSGLGTQEAQADLPATGLGEVGAVVVGGPHSNPYGEVAAVDDRAGLDADLTIPGAASLGETGLEGGALTEADRDRLAP